jgi:hypothetical protein
LFTIVEGKWQTEGNNQFLKKSTHCYNQKKEVIMSIRSKTIDNLGIRANERYAKDQNLFEAQFIKESRLIPQKTEISVLKPYVPIEFEEFFSLGKQVPWAVFSPPPNYYPETKPLFSYQVIPSLGTYEKQEDDEDKLEGLKDVLEKHHKKRKVAQSLEETKDEERERKILVSLFQCINHLDKALSFINARRNQYQRG